MRLTKRERIMITMLIFVSLWGSFFYFLMIPQYLRSIDYTMQIDSIQAEIDEMDIYLTIADSLGEMVIRQDESSDAFLYKNLDDVYADRLLQQIAEDTGVELISLELESVRPVERIMPEVPAEDVELFTRETGPDVSEDLGMVLKVQTVRLNIRGNADSIMTMADRIYHTDKSLVVTALDVIPGATPGNAGEMEGTLTIVYYYIEQ